MSQGKGGASLLFALRRLFAPGAAAPGPAAATNPPSRPRAARSSVQVGRFSFVGLSHVRQELGARWPAYAQRVNALAESVISRHLAPGDVFEMNEEGDYVVLFCQLSEREAEFKARAIGREITRRLLGTEWREQSTVETVVSAIPSAAVGSDDLAAILTAAFARGSRFLSSPEDEAELTGGEPAGRPEAPAPPPDEASPASPRGAPIGRLPPNWRYTPIWDFNHNALIYFRIAPATEAAPVLTGPALVQATFSADLAALRKAGGDMVNLAAQGKRLPVICPIHGGALEYPARRRELLEAIREHPAHVRRLLTIELTAPPDWPRSRALAEFIQTARSLTVSVSARQPANMSVLSGLADLPGPVTVQLPAKLPPEANCIRFLEAFAARAKRARLECGVAGLTSRSLAMAASAAGFRYLSGKAIHQPIPTLDQATRFDLARLYAELLPA